MSEKDYDTMLAEISPWLEHGDRKELAGELDVSPDYVSRCLSKGGRARSWRILRAAAKKAAENKAAINSSLTELKRIGA